MPAKKKVLIIDDHPLFRESSKRIINRSAAFEVIGEAGDGREGERLAIALKPDVAVVDLSLPDKSGIQLTSILTTALPGIKIVIVSMHAKIDYIVSALRAGALGYVVKESVSQCLLEGLERAMNGEYYLDPSLTPEIVMKLIEPSEQTCSADMTYGALSQREQEVLRLVAQGVSTKEIAEKLQITAKTVDNHRANIRAKLDLHNTADLVRYATKMGLLGDSY
jgi:DNA-binding NarL/FixJ family response regulator